MTYCGRFVAVSRNAAAKAARRDLEAGLDCSSWAWSCSTSRGIDSLILIEDSDQ